MDPQQLWSDARFNDLCVFCGALPRTRDHAPSKVLLDEPFPADLPVVPACAECNQGFSLDEQYLACFLECVIVGSTNPSSVRRDKVRRILAENPNLSRRIDAACLVDEAGEKRWTVESERVRKVILKLARGHAAFEYSEPQLTEPEFVSFVPLFLLSEEQLQKFETPPDERIFPELGSRAFIRGIEHDSQGLFLENRWRVIQEGRYRYLISHSDGIRVRMVLSEYLACEVVW